MYIFSIQIVDIFDGVNFLAIYAYNYHVLFTYVSIGISNKTKLSDESCHSSVKVKKYS